LNNLHNLWLLSPTERLSHWRDFRITEASKQTDRFTELRNITEWWAFVPRVNLTLDPFDISKWPTIWEIVADGVCCKYSLGLAVGLAVHYIDPTADVKIARVRNTDGSDEYFVAIVEDEYILNSSYGQVVNLTEVENKIDIRASWDIQDVLTHGYNLENN
jgi:hypothetical protein